MTPRTNNGFTLIELIVVIAVLSILAAVALPKFADFTAKAETAAFDGVQGGLIAGLGMVHSKWLVEGKTSPVAMDGANVVVTGAGWPTLGDASQNDADKLWAMVMSGTVPSGWTTSESVAGSWAEYDPPFSVADFGTDILRYEEVGGKVCKGATGAAC